MPFRLEDGDLTAAEVAFADDDEILWDNDALDEPDLDETELELSHGWRA